MNIVVGCAVDLVFFHFFCCFRLVVVTRFKSKTTAVQTQMASFSDCTRRIPTLIRFQSYRSYLPGIVLLFNTRDDL